jgi:predicted ABC-class ATPase
MEIMIPRSVEKINEKMAEMTIDGNQIIERAGGREKYVEMMDKKMAMEDFVPKLPSLEEIEEFRKGK